MPDMILFTLKNTDLYLHPNTYYFEFHIIISLASSYSSLQGISVHSEWKNCMHLKDIK